MDTSIFSVLFAALGAGCADGTMPASSSLNDPSNPRAPEALVATQPAFGASPKVGSMSEVSGGSHYMSGMKHDMSAMPGGGPPAATSAVPSSRPMSSGSPERGRP
jgi:hypothetical protein